MSSRSGGPCRRGLSDWRWPVARVPVARVPVARVPVVAAGLLLMERALVAVVGTPVAQVRPCGASATGRSIL